MPVLFTPECRYRFNGTAVLIYRNAGSESSGILMEKKEFLKVYDITVLGTRTYYRRENITDFLIHYPDVGSDSLLPAVHTYIPSDSKVQWEDTVITSPMHTQHILHQIICQEAQQETGIIRIIAQPDAAFIIPVLQSLGTQYQNLTYYHLLCMDSSTHDWKNKDYNITYLPYIMKLFQTKVTYKPRYYYDNVDSHFHNGNLYSYMVLTSEHVLYCTSDGEKGILLHEPAILEQAREMFEKLYERSTPLFNSLSKAVLNQSWAAAMQQFMGEGSCWCISAYPCILPYLNRKNYTKYLTQELPDRDTFIEYMSGYSQKIYQDTLDGKIQSFITGNGIDYFMETGMNHEFPDEWYVPMQLEDRIGILTQIRNMVAAEHILLLTGPLSNMPLNIECLINGNNNGVLMTMNQERQIFYYNMDEPELLYSFKDYMESLKDSEHVMPTAQACEYLDEKIAVARQK